MVHILKIYHKAQNDEMQIRRLAVNSDVVSRFDLLTKKIREIYPTLTLRSFDVKWKDPENDMIYMSSDEELAQALANAEDSLLKVYVCASDLKDANGNDGTEVKNSYIESHPNVICDICDKDIHGPRYKCLQCRNYDLCSACNAANKHDGHDMIKLVRPAHISREWVFMGSRKLWKSMFGRFNPATDCRNQREEPASKSPTDQPPKEKHQWHAVIEDLLKGDYVPVEKIIKDNFGNLLNLVESVAGVDVRLENCPFKSSPCPNMNDVKVDASANEKPSENIKQNVTVKDEPMQAQGGETNNNNNGTDKNAALEKNTSNAKDAVLVEVESAPSVTVNAVDHQIKEPSKPVGLFSDLDTSINADGWTLLNEQEAEKKDAVTIPKTGAIPKTLYPPVQKVKELEQPQESTASVAQNPAEPEASSFSQNPEIINALYKMKAMGFTNEGGWLERLLITKDGNINAALDSLYPNTRRQ